MTALRLALAALAGAATGALGVAAGPATAHPLGNFSVNEYQALTLYPDRIAVTVYVNTAELPTIQDRALVDTDGDGTTTDAERTAYAGKACAEFGAGFGVDVAGQHLIWAVTPGEYEYTVGSAGLPTARLACRLTAPAPLAAPATIVIANQHRADRIGWHEMTAVGDGVRLITSPLPQRSISDELRAYPPGQGPSDLVDIRTATLQVAPGSGTGPGTGSGTGPVGGGSAGRPKADDLLTSSTMWAERSFEHLAAGHLTPLLATLAVLLAVLLGCGHAALPGHGKTVLAAYIAGRDGRPRDALLIGATVTATHTGGVLIMGLVLTTTTALAGERLLSYLGVISGLLIVSLGVGLLVTAIRRRRQPHPDPDPHTHPHEHAHEHGHSHPHGGSRWSRRLGLAGMGVAGGLVPSPSALIVLLAAVGLGRAVFGVILVIAYGLGMAVTLTAAGLLLLAVQRRVTRPGGRLARLGAAIPAVAPLATAALVIIVGIGLTIRATTSL